MKNITLFLFAVLSFSLNGYSQKVSKQQDSVIKAMTPPEGKAIVFVVRPSEYGSAIEMDVHFDTVYMGKTSAKTYLYTILNPGTYTFTSKAENKSKLELTVEAGKIYYVEQAIKMGIMYARAHLNSVTEEAGLKFMKKCRMEQSNVYGR